MNKETGEIIKNLIKETNSETGEETFINYELYKPSNKNQEIILKKDPITNEEILVDKNSGEILNNLIKKIDPKTGETVIINKNNGEILKNIIISKDPISGEDIFIKLTGDKDENGNEIPLEETEFEIFKDPISGKLLAINKLTKQPIDLILIHTDSQTNQPIFINKNTGKVINNIITKFDPISGEQTFINYQKINPIQKEVLIKKDDITGNEILYDKETKKPILNILKKKDKKTGEIILINKETGEKINNIIITIDPINGKEKLIMFDIPKNSKRENLDIKLTEIEVIKDSRTGSLRVINKNTNEEIDNIEVEINPLNKDEYIFIDKINGEKIQNIIKKLDPNTGEEVFVKYDIMNINDLDIIISKDPITGKEKLINQVNGKIINDLIYFKDNETGKIILINKESGEKILNFKITKDPLTGNEIIHIKNSLDNEKEKTFLQKKEIMIYKDPNTGKLLPLNKKTGETIENVYVKHDPNTDEIILIDKQTGQVIKNLLPQIDPKTGDKMFIQFLDDKNEYNHDDTFNIESGEYNKNFENGNYKIINKNKRYSIDNHENENNLDTFSSRNEENKGNSKENKENPYNQSGKFSIVSNDSLNQYNNNLNENFFDSNNVNDNNMESEEMENEEEDDENIRVYDGNYYGYGNINEVIKEVDEEYDETMRTSFQKFMKKNSDNIINRTGNFDNLNELIKKGKKFNTFNFKKMKSEEIKFGDKENEIEQKMEKIKKNLNKKGKVNKKKDMNKNFDIENSNFSIKDENKKKDNLQIQSKEQSFNLYGTKESSSLENSTNQNKYLYSQFNQNSISISEREITNDEPELMGVNNLPFNKIKLKKNMNISNEDGQEIDNFIQKLKIKNTSKNSPLSKLKNQKEQELILLKLKKAEINKQRQEFNNYKKDYNSENEINLDENNRNKTYKENQSMFRKLIPQKNKIENYSSNPLNENLIKGKKSFVSIFDQYTSNSNKKSYVSIFDEYTPSKRVESENNDNFNFIEDIQNIGNENKEEYDFFDTQKFQDIKKNISRDTSKINIKNLFKEKNSFGIGSENKNNLYLNKVKEDMKNLEKSKNKKSLILNSEKKNDIQVLWENKSSRSIKKENLKRAFDGNFIMPANTLEDVIDAKSTLLYGNNLNNK